MAASAHNGGRTQFNIHPFGSCSAYETLNVLKGCQEWTYVSSSASVDPGDCAFDVNEYPTVIPPGTGGLHRLVYITPQTQRTGNWALLWDGGGTVRVSTGTTVSGSKTSAAGSTGNRYEFSMSSSPSTISLFVGVVSVQSSTDYPHNMRLVHCDDEFYDDETALTIRGEIFGKKFLDRLRQANVGVLRIFGPMGSFGDGVNDSTITTWASRRPMGAMSYVGEETRLSMYGGVTTNAGDDYSITTVGTYAAGSGAPVDNETMIIKWSATATGNSPTLNKDGTGAVPIIVKNGTLLTTGGHTGRPGANLHATVIYKAKLNAWLCFGTDLGRAYLKNGAPPEIGFLLCAELGAHPYYPAPFLASDPVTDFMPSLAAYIEANRPAWMRPKYEIPNEVWNSSNFAFCATTFGRAVQLVDNGGSLSSVPSYSASAMTWSGSGATGNSTLTIGAHTLKVGASVGIVSSGLSGGFNGSTAFVTDIAVGGDPTVIKINRAPTGGTFSSVTITAKNDDHHSWAGKVAANLGQAIANALGIAKADVKTVQNTKYDFLLGVPTVSGSTTSGTSGCDERLAATSNVLRGGEPAYSWVTHVCCAQYFSPSVYGDGNIENSLATAYAGGDNTAPETYIGYCGGVAGGHNLNALLTRYTNWKAWASQSRFNVNKMCGYEGGYSPDYGSDSALNNLRKAGKHVQALLFYDYRNQLNFIGLTGTGANGEPFTVEFPSNFVPFGRVPDDNAWEILVDIYESPDPPTWQSICKFNARLRPKLVVIS